MSTTPAAPFVALHAVSYATPDGHLLLDGIDLAFGAERTGLVGRNGIGKSTLLGLIAGDVMPRSGTVQRSGRVGVLRQIVQVGTGETVATAFGIADDLARLERLAAGRGSIEDAAEADWTLDARLHAALGAVGLPEISPTRPLAMLSGGQRTRLALAALLFAEPDLVLLDEPTNNLDAEGRAAVRDVLSSWWKGAVVVSHDRALLRHMDRIVELSTLGARVYGGGYDLYAERRAAERATAERDREVAKRAVAETERRIQAARERQDRSNARGGRQRAKGDQPKMLLDGKRERSEQTGGAGSRLAERQLNAAAEALAAAEAEVERVKTLSVRLPRTGLAARREVLAFHHVGFSYRGAPPLLDDVTLTLAGHCRVALSGANGSGKTTFLKLATSALSPTAGVVRRPVAAAMLDQDAALLDRSLSVLDNFRRRNPEVAINHAHAVLARFLFRAEAAHARVGQLSGGELLRAGLACVIGGTHPPPLLLLDEPTNHLDLDSIAAIESALVDFDGAILVASHDEAFLSAIGVELRLRFPLRGDLVAYQ